MFNSTYAQLGGSTRNFAVALLCFAMLALASGCREDKDTLPVTPVDYGSLSDPSIKPRVVFSLPENNAVGPFKLFDTGDGYAYPHFVIRFNKLMNLLAFSDTLLTCEGFDVPVRVRIKSSTYMASLTGGSREDSARLAAQSPYKKEATSVRNSAGTESYSDIVAFDVVAYPPSYYSSRMRYKVGQTYTMRLKAGMEDINGNQTTEEFTLTYKPEPELRVTGLYPKNGSKDVFPGDSYSYSTASVYFNSLITESGLAALQLTPQTGGRWMLGNDRASAFFRPTRTLRYGAAYTVRVPQTFADSSGKTLGKDVVSEFTTVAFKVSSFLPAGASTNVPLSSYLRIFLSGFADTTGLRSAVTLTPSPGYNIYVSGSAIELYSPLGYSMLGLQPNTTYTLGIKGSVRAVDSVSTLGRDTSITFTTENFRITSVSRNTDPYYASNQSIDINCNAPIDISTANSALAISPAVTGSISLPYSNTLRFTASSGFAPGTIYSVTVKSGLKTTLGGSTLGKDTTFSVATEPFRVTNFSPPTGSTNAALSDNITVRFSVPINSGTVSPAFQISPAVQGSFSFYSSNEFSFDPFNALAPGTTYTVTLNSALRAATGNIALGGDTSFTFTTEPFRLTQFQPNPTYPASLNNSSLLANFNSTLDPASVASAFSILPATSGVVSPYGGYQVSFTPTNGWRANTAYTATFKSSLKTTGGALFGRDTSITFVTEAFRVTDFYPYNGSAGVSRSAGINVYCNSALDSQTLNSAFSISPAIAGTLSASSGSLYFSHTTPFAANTTYTVTLSTALKSLNGDSLQAPYTFFFTTGN